MTPLRFASSIQGRRSYQLTVRPMNALNIANLCFAYDDGPAILGPLNIDIPRHGITAILGPSGCGKSTLLRLVAGLYKPQSGHIGSAFARSELGFVFQDPTLLDWASVTDNMLLPLTLNGAVTEAMRQRGDDILRQLGLEGFQDYLPRQLSGGMRMRLSLARALIAQPKLLLLDEPFAALDEIIRNRLDEELRSLVLEQSMTALFVTHSVSESVFLADRIMMMSKRPGLIKAIIDIDGPKIRDINWRESAPFRRHCRDLIAKLEDVS